MTQKITSVFINSSLIIVNFRLSPQCLPFGKKHYVKITLWFFQCSVKLSFFCKTEQCTSTATFLCLLNMLQWWVKLFAVPIFDNDKHFKCSFIQDHELFFNQIHLRNGRYLKAWLPILISFFLSFLDLHWRITLNLQD